MSNLGYSHSQGMVLESTLRDETEISEPRKWQQRYLVCGAFVLFVLPILLSFKYEGFWIYAILPWLTGFCIHMIASTITATRKMNL